MIYFSRKLEKVLEEFLQIFPVVAVTGPRQSGKSTLLRKVYNEKYTYITFDDSLMIDFFENDPKGFIIKYYDKVIFDEVQKNPGIFSYIKMAVDNDRNKYGKFILTGSSQFTLIDKITESLAGRIGMLSLLPFQKNEIPANLHELQIIKGSYPELIAREYKNSREWYASYINTYLEKDVRSIYNLGNLRDFQKLIMLLAARCSQELNLSVLANEIGITAKTLQKWISVLESSYIIFLLPSYHKNLGKRIVKRPKIFFYDTGIICYLTGISNLELLEKGPLAGPVFENYIISEIKKTICHLNLDHSLYYFRNNQGLESDLIIQDRMNNKVLYLEIKNNHTPKYKMVENLKKLLRLEKESVSGVSECVEGYLIYKGEESGQFTDNIYYQNLTDFLSLNYSYNLL